MISSSAPGPAGLAAVVEKIWRDVLGVPGGQTEATFFELSGQSITAVLIANRVEEELGVTVDVEELFDDPDLADFIGKVAEAARAAEPEAA
ncbi:phosphopantetheine-binding protein [Amycolatopsis antarctica]|nr:phosphopantetheine-binding protein [Amycolatopsis antarctica]